MKVFITGGAGFIGINSAHYFLQKGDDVVIFDNFSRVGADDNVKWLSKATKKNFSVVKGDVCFNQKMMEKGIRGADLVLHLAGQVAVTTSVLNPREDFESNAFGTFNILEVLRLLKSKAVFIYSSSNKVYGELENLRITEGKTKYLLKDLPYGVSEEQGLDFHSPYGCSKGAGDQYVHDYSRIYDLNTIVFRQSCIYGPRQFGIEDQGWLAWFIIALTYNKKITIFGNGKQVRDILFVEDLVKAYDLAARKISKTKGRIYNIGGGPANAISIWLDLKPILEKLFDRKIEVSYKTWRPGDQSIYVSDIRRSRAEFGWKPTTSVDVGIKKLFNWISKNKEIFEKIHA